MCVKARIGFCTLVAHAICELSVFVRCSRFSSGLSVHVLDRLENTKQDQRFCSHTSRIVPSLRSLRRRFRRIPRSSVLPREPQLLRKRAQRLETQ